MGHEEFIAGYEERIKDIKSEFEAYKSLEKQDLSEGKSKFLHNMDYENKKNKYVQALEDIQRFVISNQVFFDVTKVSSILGCPSKELLHDERIFHRLWVGGQIPEDTKESIRQWHEAAKFVKRESSVIYESYLWVWNKAQIINDSAFELCENDEDYTIGYYHIGSAKEIVKSIYVMSAKNSFVDLEMMQELIDKKFYNYLSDYYRDVFLYLFGGIYMDIDTIPHRFASVYLSKPEVPNYYEYKISPTTGTEIKTLISWANIWQFEGGVQIAKRGNPAVKAIVDEMNLRLKKISRPIKGIAHDPSDKDMKTSLQLYDATYVVWASDLRKTYIPLDELAKEHSTLLVRKTERVLLGLTGFRLEYDPTTNSSMPLTPEEKWHHDNTIDNLNQRNWRLDNPLDLADFASIIYADEVPRLGYNLQVRAENSKFNYYAFATDDNNLHRVNDLFGRYLLYVNRAKMAKPNFWVTTKAKKSTEELVLYLYQGKTLTNVQKDRMAFLLLETSYLEYCSIGNKLHLHKVALQRIQNIDQNIDFCWAIFINSEMIGFYIAGVVSELKKINFTSYYRDEVKHLDEAYDAFVEKNIKLEDYFLSSLAIEQKYRGLGYFKFMFAQNIKQAKQCNCKRIVLTVWEKGEALQLYLKIGFKFVDTFDYAYNLFYERLYLLEYALTED